MHYFIDGYNLLFRTLHSGDNLQIQRQELIAELENKCRYLELNVTIVFDSHYQPDDGSRSHYNNLEVCFTALSETADDYIIQELKESATSSQKTVVTSDRHLAWRCRRYLAKTESVENFMSWLEKRVKNKRRQQRLANKILNQTTVEKSKKVIAVEQLPEEKGASEGSFEFYLQTFEEEYKKHAVAEKPKQPTFAKADKVKKKTPPKEPLETDMQRWLRCFEGNE